MKSVIAPIVDFINLNAIDNIDHLEALKFHIKKSNGKVLHGIPKLNKFLELIEKRIEDLKSLEVESFGLNEQQDGAANSQYQAFLKKVVVEHDLLEDYYIGQIQDRMVDLIHDDDEDLKMLKGFN